MNNSSTIFIAGHKGLVGSAIVRALVSRGFGNLIMRTRAELDLTRQDQVQSFFAQQRPEYVFLAAAKVGGIFANSAQPAEFIHENLAVQTNVIDSAYRCGVKKLLFLGSSCIYPKHAPQPIREEYLLSGALEPTNDAYAVAKIAGIKMAQAYRSQYGFNAISIMPTNLYGPGDNYDLNTSHVLPAMIRKFHEAKIARSEVVLWGTGQPRREFMHVDDLADACMFLMDHYDSDDIINVGVGSDVTIAELAEFLRGAPNYRGNILYDTSKPDGTPRKLLDVSKLHSLGWHARIPLPEGIRETYKSYALSIGDAALDEVATEAPFGSELTSAVANVSAS
jgi:GDP-L-fucose synthase